MWIIYTEKYDIKVEQQKTEMVVWSSILEGWLFFQLNDQASVCLKTAHEQG